VFELKQLSKEGIPGALDKAVRYRLLGQPREAESIYLDVLQADPNQQPALVGLFLALTDQFDLQGAGIFSRAHAMLPRLDGDYERAYYTGIYYERRAHAAHHQAAPGHVRMAYELLHEAMGWYERAEPLRKPGDDDALLRWNACARLAMRYPRPDTSSEERFEPYTDA
jgi:tetratricopeptide (TPR) repeat protein